MPAQQTQTPPPFPALRQDGPPEPSGRSRSAWSRGLPASAAVTLAAVPLSLGIALAASLPLQAGLIAAVVAGIAGAVFGAAPARAGGTAACLVLVTAELVQRQGWQVTCGVIALVGLVQLALGAPRVARLASAFSPAVARGMLTGVGATIVLGQAPVVLGGGPQPSSLAGIRALLSELTRPQPAALLAAAVTVVVLTVWPRLPGRAGRLLRLVPAPFAALALAMGASLSLNTPRVSFAPWESRVLPGLPDGPVLGIFAAVLTLTLAASAQSLRSLLPTPVQEWLRPRGAVSPGAARPGSHAGAAVCAVCVLLCAGLPTAVPELVPLSAVAALAVAAGLRSADLAQVKQMSRHREFPMYVATLGSVLLLGVVQGVVVGMVIAALLPLPGIARSLRGRGKPTTDPAGSSAHRPWTPWRHHDRAHRAEEEAGPGETGQLLGGVSAFQRDTAPLVRDELARLAREGQRPSQLFLTCADSRLVTSMITSSGPGDLFTVRNVGNLLPPPGDDGSCDSVGAAVEYAVEVLKVGNITVCGHSGCGAMQALLDLAASPAGHGLVSAQTPLTRWLRHGRPSLARMQRIGRLGRGEVALADRPVADDVERLALVNILQQLDHLMAHPCVARRVAEGSLRLQGMYFHVGEAQAYVLDRRSRTFTAVRPAVLDAV
ncbi:carbonic anhydrase [Streptomyces hesseae]|uniref:carbonic anhydrase n=1 Tax=Streptomyces hesseae TaxID=3075519 RepID=A0ABU2SUW0_9ACTN|nr:carbonic anhydrase [Streptomyces sp. DSM 40473]MDT0452786.1 carbonic anhydrase [Streptomyces sp. DSM 40473]